MEYMIDFNLPDFPAFSNEYISECISSNDISPILFEWYKFSGISAYQVAEIPRDEETWETIPDKIEYAIMVGKLTRCAKLTQANLALSFEGKNGEATSIIDRCIFETAIKIQWLCTSKKEDRFQRYLADGLKSDLVAKKNVLTSISQRGYRQNIESRILNSIEKRIKLSGLNEDIIESSKKMPDLFSMLDELGHSHREYVFGQKIISHNVHGNWTALLWYYLNIDDKGNFSPNGEIAPTSQDQFAKNCFNIIESIKCFISYFRLRDKRIEHEVLSHFNASLSLIHDMYDKVVNSDLENVEDL